jgi:dihydrofolate synthase / folylpolyglutamate synthase
MTYSEAIQFLYNLRLFGAKLGLDNTLRLAALVGNPQERLAFIHVAGTNGKGSTCAMLEGIYRAAGLKVGLFTSPHLVTFSERLQVNRQPIAERDVVRLVGRLQQWVRAFPSETHPTFFEVVTIMALDYFAEQECDLVIWETGLGGRLDATNIVKPLASVITNVQLDHQQWLGNTLAEIAVEKAGIIKSAVPVITATEAPEAVRVIKEKAASCQAACTVIDHRATGHPPLDSLELPLLGEHQRLNAALAIATVRTLHPTLPVSDRQIREGLMKVDWPGRLQRVDTESGATVLLDGAHNPAGAATLRAAFEKYFRPVQPALILGMLRDKDWPAMCEILAPLAQKIFLVPVHSQRTTAPEALQSICHRMNPTATLTVCASMVEALERTKQERFVIVTGSLYLVGEAMEVLQHKLIRAHTERDLNEWQAAPVAKSVCASVSS